MTKRSEIPQFGPLQGVRVVHATLSLAGPVACEFMAELGADVIQIETPFAVDTARLGGGWTAEQDRRNQRNISLNCASKQGKEAFLRIIKDADIFMEASKPGQYASWGLTDEVMWEVNPQLTIVHISGYGQTGDPSYVSRAGYDGIVQATGGLMYINSVPGQPSVPILASVADYYTTMHAATAALAGYIRAKETGVGDSVDIAQFECVLRTQMTWPMFTWNLGMPFDRENNHDGSSGTAGFKSYMCKDGIECYINVLGAGVVKSMCNILGWPYGAEEGAVKPGTMKFDKGTPEGDRLEEALTEYFAARTSAEAEAELAGKGIPCGAVMRYEDMLDHPHFKARESIVETHSDILDRDFYSSNIVARFKKEPGQFWRPAPRQGQDNDDVLAEAGYTPEEIAELYEAKTIIQR